MSAGGFLAAALGGAANAIGQQAGDDITQGRRIDLARETAAIEEQMRMRLAENQERLRQSGELANVTGPLGDAKLAYKGRERTQENEAAVGQARAMIPVQQEAARATAATTRDVMKEAAADADFLKAGAAIKLADPEVKARLEVARAAVAASGAAAAASRAHSGLLDVQTEGAKIDVSDKKKLGTLYDQAGAILTDASIDDAERGKRLTKVQQQIVLIKSKTGQTKERDPELDTQTVTEEKVNPDGTTTKVQRKEVRHKGGGSEAGAPYADGTELRGKDGQLYVVQGGQPVLKSGAGKAAAAPPATRRDPIDGRDLTEREWDKKYGKGDFKNLYAPGEPSLKAF